ncbi:hypothetical protein [Rhizobium wuzhouense]|uniref:Uncharacterized protein n=1 Tax=Rhizobium wuzhouense TaxID=1986026 RepID=A0ABX5NRC1_9HYPH|nr:hypothetical protein [Rhizobium wuzhouense]PYB71254.1 hypothetical protein DMY87_17980 [Rhizobium wuzhouense]
MEPGDVIPGDQPVARSIIFPTHLPQAQLSEEALINFQKVEEVDERLLGGWAHVYGFSVTCLGLCDMETAHQQGIDLADEQNRSRPLPERDDLAFIGNKRAYLGYYTFSLSHSTSEDGEDDVLALFWPEGKYEHHGNVLHRVSGELPRKERTSRRVKIQGRIWRSLQGPERYAYQDHPHAAAIAEIPLPEMPTTKDADPQPKTPDRQ